MAPRFRECDTAEGTHTRRTSFPRKRESTPRAMAPRFRECDTAEGTHITPAALPKSICGKRPWQVILEAIVIAQGDQEYG